jgi:hypothetical protein
MTRPFDRIAPKSEEDEYLPGTEACKVIGCTHKHLKALVEAGKIGTWQLPGSRPRYSKRDCQAAAAAAFRPAQTTENITGSSSQ